jgi:hypothetical protein
MPPKSFVSTSFSMHRRSDLKNRANAPEFWHFLKTNESESLVHKVAPCLLKLLREKATKGQQKRRAFASLSKHS